MKNLSEDTSSKEILNPKVGIFWFIAKDGEDSLIMDAVPYPKGEPYGDTIQHGEHYNFWKMLEPETIPEIVFKSRAYDAYPRGRVVFFSEVRTFCNYLDRCLSVGNLTTVCEVFGLVSDKFRITFNDDEHYQCAICNRNWTEDYTSNN